MILLVQKLFRLNVLIDNIWLLESGVGSYHVLVALVDRSYVIVPVRYNRL